MEEDTEEMIKAKWEKLEEKILTIAQQEHDNNQQEHDNN